MSLGNSNKSKQCIRYEFDSLMAKLILYITAFTVALAISDAIRTAINDYYGTDSVTSKVVYALVVFVVAVIIIWIVVKYVMPPKSCNKWT